MIIVEEPITREHVKEGGAESNDDVLIKALIDHIIINADSMEIYFIYGVTIEQKSEKQAKPTMVKKDLSWVFCVDNGFLLDYNQN